MSDPNSNAVSNPLSRLPASLFQLYQGRLTFWSSRLVALEQELVALEASPVESYSFSAGEGQQQAKRRSYKEVAESYAHAERMYSWYWKKCNGYGLVNMTLRRR